MSLPEGIYTHRPVNLSIYMLGFSRLHPMWFHPPMPCVDAETTCLLIPPMQTNKAWFPVGFPSLHPQSIGLLLVCIFFDGQSESILKQLTHFNWQTGLI